MNGRNIWKKVVFCITMLALLAASFSDSGQAASPTSSKPPILIGTYVLEWLDQSSLEQNVIALDQWTGKQSSIVGLTRDFEDTTAYISLQLDLIWNNGYTPILNLDFGYYSEPTAYQIATGQKDSAIINWAQTIASWAAEGKWLYLAPMPEMNTTWVSYGQDPENYQLAYARIRQIFTQYNVPDSAVQWVFAPNGWAHLVFEPYYPGDALVDVVGFSARNQGFCSTTNAEYWNPPGSTFGFSIKEFNRLAPDKPIFITGVATTALTSSGYSDTNAKNQWLLDAYNYLAVQYGVQAVIYTNYVISWECQDWPIFDYGNFAYEGYKWGVANQAYGYLSPSELANTDLSPSLSGDVFAPIVNKGSSGSGDLIMLGMYTQNWTGLQRVIVSEVNGLNNWSGKHISILGTFVDFTSIATDEIELQLEVIWENGYVPFLNLTTIDSYFTAKRIADGEADNYLREVARSYAMFAKGGTQMAYVAPLIEMNGSWAPYQGDPTNFILAYKRIQQIFTQEGVPDQSVAWVFAPNGSSAPQSPEMELYYPGDAYVDYVGFTAYNFGYCTGIDPQWRGWITPDVAIGTYLTRIIALAPSKQVIIAQTGTTAVTQYGVNDAAKNAWLTELYEYLEGFPQIHAVLYFNRWDSDCDWAVFNPNGSKYDGYISGISIPTYGYFTQFQQLGFFNP